VIWVFFLLNLSQELKFVLLLYFGTLGDGYSLKAVKNSLHGTVIYPVVISVQVLFIFLQKQWSLAGHGNALQLKCEAPCSWSGN
jgi:hypothetical protein